MVSFKGFATAAALTSLLPASFAFDADLKSNVAVYYGQGAYQPRLSHFCEETSLDIINLGFVNSFPSVVGQWPGSNFGNQCDGSYYLGSTLLSGCHQIWEDIPVCQALGKKVLLSIGGDSAYPIPLADDVAKWFADFLWYSFGPNQAEAWYDFGLFDSHVKSIFPRPFQNVSVDGFDFDVEHNGAHGYATMINRLRSRFEESPDRKFYISGSPQCPIPDAQLGDAIKNSAFDFVWVQFYNSGGCSAADYANGTGEFNYGAWVDVIKNSANPSAKLYVGLPASESAANAGFYITPSQVKPLVEEYIDLYPETFGGIMLWEATAAENNIIAGSDYLQHMKSILYECAPPPKPTPTPTPTHTVTPISTHTSHSSSGAQSGSSVHSSASSSSHSSSSVVGSTSSPSPSSSSPVSSTSHASHSTAPVTVPFSSTAALSSSSVISSSSAHASHSSASSSSVVVSSSTPCPSSSTHASYSPTSSPVRSSSTAATSSSSSVSSSTKHSSKTTTRATSHASTHTSSTEKSATPSGTPKSTSTILVIPTPASSSSASVHSSSSSTGNSMSTPLGSTKPSSSSTAQNSHSSAPLSSHTTLFPSQLTTPVQSHASTVQTTLSQSTHVSWPMSSPVSSTRKVSTQTRSTKTGGTSETGINIITSSITASPSVTSTPSSSQPETVTTVIVTSYTSICPTGFTTITTTYTTYVCPEATATATATATPDVTNPAPGEAATTASVPEGWTTTVTVCTHCAATPTTVTLTLPNPTTADTTSAPTSKTAAASTESNAMTTTETWTTTVTFCKHCGPTGSTLTLTVPHTPTSSVPANKPTGDSGEGAEPSVWSKTTVIKSGSVISSIPTSQSQSVGTGVGGVHPIGQSQSQTPTFAVHRSSTNTVSRESPAPSGTQAGASSTYTGDGPRSVLINVLGVAFAGALSMVMLM